MNFYLIHSITSMFILGLSKSQVIGYIPADLSYVIAFICCDTLI